jgi:hypothetical protein
LIEVASDDDDGGFLTSALEFNAQAGTTYQIAIDGLSGQSGDIVLSWNLVATAETLPEIVTQPVSQTVNPGDGATFSVGVSGTGLVYQWYFNDAIMAGATSSNLVVSNVQIGNVGTYKAQVSRGTRSVFSEEAALQINGTEAGSGAQREQATDKYADVFLEAQSAGAQKQEVKLQRHVRRLSLARGYSGTQIFNTFGSVKEPGEPNHCGVIGGASQWFAYKAESSGTLLVSTEGSDFDTVLAVYTGNGADFGSLTTAGCDDNSGADGKSSVVRIAAGAGTIYYIVVDGVKAATGHVKLSYNLAVPFRLSVLDRVGRLHLAGRPGGTYTIQGSTNFVNCFPLVTSNTALGVF